MSNSPINNANPPEANYGIDREINDQPPGLMQLLLAQSTGDASPGRRNAMARPAGDQAASAFADHDRFQAFGGWSPTNAIDADTRLYNTSDQQPAMPLEITGAYRPAPGHYLVKGADDLNYSGLFDTDHIDPRMPESQQNLMNQAYRTGMGPTQDQAVAKMFDDLKLMTDPGTMNSQGEGTIGAAMSGKEAAMRGRLDARRRYGLWR